MKKVVVGLGIFAMIFIAANALTQEATITLDACGEKKSAVTFSHEGHVAVADCTVCHHTAEGLTADSGVAVKKCTECHLNPENAETLCCSQMSVKKNPYHVNCIGCHKAQAAGPTKCAECHPKE